MASSAFQTTGITQQQAMMLLPLLQQIASGTSPTSANGATISATPSPSTSSASGLSSASNGSPFFVPVHKDHGYSTDGSEKSACRYSSDDLYKTKKGNCKSTEAHSYCHVSEFICALV